MSGIQVGERQRDAGPLLDVVGADTDDSVAGSEATAIKEAQVERENSSFGGKATRACHITV